MKPITKAQRKAIKCIYDRGQIYLNGKSSAAIAIESGWRYVAATDLPEGSLRERMEDAGYTHAWVHDKYLPVYMEACNIVTDYRLATRMSYRQFRKTVHHGLDCLLVKWSGMCIGIEENGYTHS